MKVVFPVEYCPTSITSGFPSKSGSSSLGEWNSWKWYSFSSGRRYSEYTFLRPEVTSWQ